MKVSACLVSRTQNIDWRILKSLEWCDEILIGDGEKYGVYGRFVATQTAKNDIIYTQDDDFLVTDFDRLFNKWDGVFVAHHNCRMNRKYPPPITTIGYGALFNRWETEAAFDFYQRRYGKDPYFYRECDRIVTGLMNPVRAGFNAAPYSGDFYQPTKIGMNLPQCLDADRLSQSPDHRAYWSERTRVLALAKTYPKYRRGQ